MKKLYPLLALIATTVIFAQAPQGFNYQATVRNSAGALIVNQNVFFKFNIMLNSASSLPVFSETHMTPTDDLGQVNLVIGTGTATTGNFSTINWGTGNYYLGIELNTGAGYVAMGTTQLLSVPYALYANSSGNAQTPTPNLAAVLAVNNGANNLKITNLAEPTTAQDAATKNYVDNASTGNTILADGSIFIGNASNTATAVALSGDVTISNTGVATISDNAVSTSNITDANITNSKLDKANIPLSGFGAATADVNLGTKKLTNVADPTTAQDAATKNYIDNIVPNGNTPGDIMMWSGTNWDLSSNLLPKINTTQASSITSNSCQVGGEIISIGGSNIIRKGICYSEQIFPTVADGLVYDISSNVTFNSNIENLTNGRTYYVRSFAENSFGIKYGNEVSFTTLVALPVVTTTTATSITTTTAISGGVITSIGGGTISARGIVWSTSSDPTITTNQGITSGVSSTGSFTSNLTGLSPNTAYYYRAYATNSSGTSYGESKTLITKGPPILTTTIISRLRFDSVISGGNVTSNGQASVTARGICWSTSPNPTIALITKTVNGDGNGIFTSSITQLNPSTTYYVRAYATNSNGTAYGQEITFTTLAIVPCSVGEVTINNQIWSGCNLDVTTYRDGTPIPQVTDPSQWANLTTGAWCYYNNNSANGIVYGKLYNWYAVAGVHNAASLNDPTLRKQLAPMGWHVPTIQEVNNLNTFLGSNGGYKLKEVGDLHWYDNYYGLVEVNNGTNEFGFTALPGGVRKEYIDVFEFMDNNNRGYWWTVSPSNIFSGEANYYSLYLDGGLSISSNEYQYGQSVRLVKD